MKKGRDRLLLVKRMRSREGDRIDAVELPVGPGGQDTLDPVDHKGISRFAKGNEERARIAHNGVSSPLAVLAARA
jgi:hypothetical protein